MYILFQFVNDPILAYLFNRLDQQVQLYAINSQNIKKKKFKIENHTEIMWLTHFYFPLQIYATQER